MWNDYGHIRYGRPPDYVSIALSHQVITSDAAVGDILGTLSTDGKGSYSFSILNNPYFVLVGNVVQVKAALFDGLSQIRVTANGSGGTFTQTLNITVIEPLIGQTPYYPPPIIIPPPPPPPPPPPLSAGEPAGLLLALTYTLP